MYCSTLGAVYCTATISLCKKTNDSYQQYVCMSTWPTLGPRCKQIFKFLSEKCPPLSLPNFLFSKLAVCRIIKSTHEPSYKCGLFIKENKYLVIAYMCCVVFMYAEAIYISSDTGQRKCGRVMGGLRAGPVMHTRPVCNLIPLPVYTTSTTLLYHQVTKPDWPLCSLPLWRAARGSKLMCLELIHGLFIT
jgi:hypothetical protein